MVASEEATVDRELGATDDELRQALAEALGLVPNDEADVFTARELAELLGIGLWAARSRANAAVEAGTMERVQVRRETRDRRVVPVMGYRLVEREE